MKKVLIKALLAAATVLAVFSCSSPETKTVAKPRFPEFDEKAAQDTKAGIMGIYKVPELLVISISDGAVASKVPERVALDYATLGRELMAGGIEVSGPAGQMMLNNDTSNFRFECFVPIKQKPAKEPGNGCMVKTLSAADMLVYNYYGSYQQLYLGYDAMRQYIDENGLLQAGSTREFYITDPTIENDPKKLLTRIMVPVEIIGAH